MRMSAVAKLFPGRTRKRTPRIEIIPMVDVMFLLLVFYILSSLAMHKDRGIPVNLPSAISGEAGQPQQDLILTVTREGKYFLNKDPVEIAELASRLEAMPGGVVGVRQRPVVLNADLSAQHRYVVRAIDELRKLEIHDFVIAIEEGEASR